MTNNEYTLVNGGEAPKVAKHSKGEVKYDVLKNQSEEVFIRMIKNDDFGTFSDEIISLWLIYNFVNQYADKNQSISAQPFKECFTIHKQNSPGFLVAVLREIGLLKEDPNDSEKHLVKGYAEWIRFNDEMLAIEGIPYTK